MQISFNEMSLGKNGSLPEDIFLCAQAGFSRIELRRGNVLQFLRRGGDAAQLRRVLEEQQVQVVNLCALEGVSFLSKPMLRLLKENAAWLFAFCRSIGCPSVEVIASFGQDEASPEEVQRETVQALRQLAELAADYGLRLALEFMAVPGSSVRSFAQCLSIVEATERDNVGMLLDTWHFYAAGGRPEELLRLKPSQVTLLHVSDCPPRQPWTALRSESYWPGDGAIPLVQILHNLHAIGYDGVCSFEGMAPEIQSLPAAQCISLARERMERLLREAKLWEKERSAP